MLLHEEVALMKIEKNISATLKKELDKRGVRFQEFAQELGIPRTTLMGYMKGASHPRADSLEYLAEKLGISLSELVSGDGAPHKDGLRCIEPVLMEIPALHPRAIPIARDAVSLLQDAFRLSDDLHGLKENEPEDESSDEVYRYFLHEMMIPSYPSPAYGILAKQRSGQDWVTITLVSAFYHDKHAVEQLAARCTKLQLSPIHLLDVIQDFLIGCTLSYD